MSGPALAVEMIPAADQVTVVLRGELDAHGEPAADAALGTAAGQTEHVVLDLRGLEFIDSSGLKLAIVWHRRLQQRGGRLTIVRGAPHVQRPFSLAGLDDLLAFVDGPPA